MPDRFSITIPNLPKLQEALAQAPAIAGPIIQNAIVGAQALLAKAKGVANLPYRTGVLSQNWAFEVGNMRAVYYPRAFYAPYVEFGTAPHDIRPVNARVLANTKTGDIFGTLVHHPGTKANPFMERIVESAQPEIADLFGTALEKIVATIAAQSQ
jgi:hypothetical protein